MKNQEEEEELTYEILEQHFKEQDRLISEGKMEKPQIIDGLSEEGWEIMRNGLTFEELWAKVEKNLGMV